jgi:hypothetical protein
MIKFIKSFFTKKEETAVETAPYKVDALAPTPVAEQATQAVVESIAPAKKPAKAKKAPAAKKPRASRKPKAV